MPWRPARLPSRLQRLITAQSRLVRQERGTAPRQPRRAGRPGDHPAADPPAVPADRAGPPAIAGPHPGRGPGCPAGGPEHTPLAGRGDCPDRRPRSRGEDHEATRSGEEARASWPAGDSLPPGWQGHGAVRSSGYAAPVHRHQTPTSGPVTGQPLARLRELLARHGIEPSRGNRPGPSRYEQALVGWMRGPGEDHVL